MADISLYCHYTSRFARQSDSWRLHTTFNLLSPFVEFQTIIINGGTISRLLKREDTSFWVVGEGVFSEEKPRMCYTYI
jgi:hypothetical protein